MDQRLAVPFLGLTGERTLPGIWHENYWYRRHEVVYRRLADRLPDGTVVDAGCGEGYGAELLADGQRGTVVAIDYDDATVRHVRAAYPSVAPVRANLVSFPLLDRSIDSVVSLQTIEHLWDQPTFVAECTRVLRPGGLLALSTPNRLTFSPGVARGEKPLNPFHVNEYDADQLVDLVSRHCVVLEVFGVRHGPRVEEWQEEHEDLVAAQIGQSPATWSAELAELVGSLTTDDFCLSAYDVGTALDLVVLGRPR